MIRETNIVYNNSRSKGWKALDSTFNREPKTYHLLFRCGARWGWYNPEMDIYLFLGDFSVRGFLKSDSIANYYYLSQDYLSKNGLIPIQEELVSSAMLKEANVDNVVSYRIRLDSPFLGKYHYAKRFLLHKQDVANITLNFIALNKGKEKEIDRAFKQIWGIIRFRPDSDYHPQFGRNALVGKFRHLRPMSNLGDSLSKNESERAYYFRLFISMGISEAKTKNISRLKKVF